MAWRKKLRGIAFLHIELCKSLQMLTLPRIVDGLWEQKAAEKYVLENQLKINLQTNQWTCFRLHFMQSESFAAYSNFSTHFIFQSVNVYEKCAYFQGKRTFLTSPEVYHLARAIFIIVGAGNHSFNEKYFMFWHRYMTYV